MFSSKLHGWMWKNLSTSTVQSGTFAAGMAVGSTLAYVTPHLNGAIDIMAVRQPDGSIKTSPFYGGWPAFPLACACGRCSCRALYWEYACEQADSNNS